MNRFAAAALFGGLVLAAGTSSDAPQKAALPALTAHEAAGVSAPDDLSDVVENYCQRCHNERRLSGNLSLMSFEVGTAADEAETAEKMIRKLRAGMMPPPGARRPAGDTLDAFAEMLEELIDEAARDRPSPGTRPFQRVNRAEYARLVKDVLGLTVDPSQWLPADQISASFDNIADVQSVSPTLMDAFLTAASEVARQAVGQKEAPVSANTYTNPPSISQHEWEPVEGAPYGTRGGISVLHSFPADGEYTFSMGFMSGWGERDHDIDVSIDGERVALVRYGGDIDFQGRGSQRLSSRDSPHLHPGRPAACHGCVHPPNGRPIRRSHPTERLVAHGNRSQLRHDVASASHESDARRAVQSGGRLTHTDAGPHFFVSADFS